MASWSRVYISVICVLLCAAICIVESKYIGQASMSRCDHDWRENFVTKTCIKVFHRLNSVRKNWHQARSECQRYGGDLVTILNENMTLFLHSTAAKTGTSLESELFGRVRKVRDSGCVIGNVPSFTMIDEFENISSTNWTA
ncbi:macrophage mannose receptor 1 [Plakobranchus ocellatus]|uniref:Macrophage mannose receptor 1 n=1 Tax=Plakobranchus ocellatus TaxID=259542 RepID=A0AAV4CL82_9GAST|nr:macrophage mannose receptor 1 [Plakobranchus ocellatus]